MPPNLRCGLLGAVIRLPDLQGPPPATWAGFRVWAGVDTTITYEPIRNALADVLESQMVEATARRLLGLPEAGPFAAKAIQSAYRRAAAAVHPDGGGDAPISSGARIRPSSTTGEGGGTGPPKSLSF